jgi:hypothetical protein
MSHKPMIEKLRDAPQPVLKALWCILWPLGKLVIFKPTWYVCRAVAVPVAWVFGDRVFGMPGKFLSITEKD